MLIASRMNVDKVRDEGHDLYYHHGAAPAREALRYEDAPTRINGSLDFQSAYRGPPSAEVDAAWANIVEVGTMRLSFQELEEMDATHRASAIQFPESKGGGYMGDLEVFHELHCVNFIRQYTYPEYYKDKVNSFSDDPTVLRMHVGESHLAGSARA
ncbi:MAG: hypothetical protein OHK93_004226 [Ramalina farinacea]|uniref:Uncharacterized protein n=1 Tax=Ramalina farinacea TaxID=258253 RepID=A0AA43QI05_9LECA|nr:hypothetical protein [Ramalina farinacea]